MSLHLDEEADSSSCPLCTEEMDITDRSFKPCRCGYQMCLWCWHNIMENVGAKCPACRTPYDKAIKAPDPSIINTARDEKRKQKSAKNGLVVASASVSANPVVSVALTRATTGNSAISATPVTTVTPALANVGDRSVASVGGGITLERQSLLNVRVMQRNLVYVIGLSPALAKEEVLREKAYFGKFGRIVKIAVNKKQVHGDAASRSYSAYITYRLQADALEAIRALDGAVLNDRQVRCTFGTTKYCSMFLRHVPCTNPGCLYLHEIAKDSDYIVAPEETAMSAVERFTQQNETIFAQEDAKSTGIRKKIVTPVVSTPIASAQDEEPIASADDEERLQQEDDQWGEVYSSDEMNVKAPPGFIVNSAASSKIDSSVPVVSKDVSVPKREHAPLDVLLPGLASFGFGKFNPGLGSSWNPLVSTSTTSTFDTPQIGSILTSSLATPTTDTSLLPANNLASSNALLQSLLSSSSSVSQPLPPFRSVTSMLAKQDKKEKSRFSFAEESSSNLVSNSINSNSSSGLPYNPSGAIYSSSSVVNTAAATALRVLNQNQGYAAPNSAQIQLQSSNASFHRDPAIVSMRPASSSSNAPQNAQQMISQQMQFRNTNTVVNPANNNRFPSKGPTPTSMNGPNPYYYQSSSNSSFSLPVAQTAAPQNSTQAIARPPPGFIKT